MTSIFFVRHAQPDEKWTDDRTKPLTAIGLQDSKRVTEALENVRIDYFYSSPYKRSIDTIKDCADKRKMQVHTDERFRERKRGINADAFLEKRWEDFSICEENGECLASVQQRNMEALTEILRKHPDKNIVIGTHGTALSTILHYYDPGFGCDGFRDIWFCMPYIIRLDFDGERLINKTEILRIERGY